MERKNYFAKGIVIGVGLSAVYAVNMSHRLSHVAELNRALGKADIALAIGEKHGEIDKTYRELEEARKQVERAIEGEKAKAYFIVDWPGIFTER